ncbi:MAG: NgoFVII family restriction endonuclease [Nitrososphaerota archaeon]|jgi:phosphatidylserine/phosphatidylglycerophosphate/cardiolipin synthase-like enzyme|nr:NgoFVII family restriction endonuclease [Nitrososphaerota archaeon]
MATRIGSKKGWYSGKSSYKIVEKIIKERANSLLVISPYITTYYARMLLSASKRKEVRVITSDSPVTSEAMKMMARKSSASGYIKSALYLIVLDIVLLVIGLYYFALLFALAFAIFVVLAIRKRAASKSTRVYVKVSRGTSIHEKLYISDSVAVVGSANLTYFGMHRNVEHLEIVTDKDKITEMRRHFDSLWNSLK